MCPDIGQQPNLQVGLVLQAAGPASRLDLAVVIWGMLPAAGKLTPEQEKWCAVAYRSICFSVFHPSYEKYMLGKMLVMAFVISSV